MRVSGSSPLGRRSKHTPKHLPNPRTAGRGVTQSRGRITYHYRGGRTVTHRRRYASSGGVNPRSVPGARVSAASRAASQRATQNRAVFLLHLLGFSSPTYQPYGSTGIRSREGLDALGFGTTDPLGRLSSRARIYGSSGHERALLRIGNTRSGAVPSAKKQAALWWKLAHEHFGGRAPKLSFGDTGNTAGIRPWGKNEIVLNPKYLRGAAGVSPKSRADLAKLLFHEWTHARQTATPKVYATSKGRRSTEGGAESYALKVAKGYGIKDLHTSYPEYVKYVRKFLGPDWITKGQFK